MPYKIKKKIRQYANIQNKAKYLQRELEEMIESYGVPIENLIACADGTWDNDEPQTEALAYLNNGECDDVDGTIEQIEEVFLWFANRDDGNEREV